MIRRMASDLTRLAEGRKGMSMRGRMKMAGWNREFRPGRSGPPPTWTTGRERKNFKSDSPRENRESTLLQYALKDRASGLGWAPSMIGVIDSDLGRSGRSADGRPGFVGPVGEVSLGRVGMVPVRDVSRLSRSLADWGQLLDLCCRTDTLIADAESVYDPTAMRTAFYWGCSGRCRNRRSTRCA